MIPRRKRETPRQAVAKVIVAHRLPIPRRQGFVSACHGVLAYQFFVADLSRKLKVPRRIGAVERKRPGHERRLQESALHDLAPVRRHLRKVLSVLRARRKDVIAAPQCVFLADAELVPGKAAHCNEREGQRFCLSEHKQRPVDDGRQIAAVKAHGRRLNATVLRVAELDCRDFIDDGANACRDETVAHEVRRVRRHKRTLSRVAAIVHDRRDAVRPERNRRPG